MSIPPTRVLILGGSTEASALARLLAGHARFDALLSLAGRTRAPRPQPLPSRSGGFGGVEGLTRFLGGAGVQLLVDATHPFAAAMSANAVAAARLAGLPLLRLDRPAWTAGEGDRWAIVPDIAAAAAALGTVPRRVLLTVGQKELRPFRDAPQHRYLVRSIEPPDPDSLPPGATCITDAGPFTEAAERALLLRHGVEVIVSKNSGGTASAAKLAAARALELPVVMVARPTLPAAETVPDAGAALRWLLRHGAASSPAAAGSVAWPAPVLPPGTVTRAEAGAASSPGATADCAASPASEAGPLSGAERGA
ncbi:cobalt-precorrin-6A reductase [Roseomonas elaeocarpi]